MWLQPMNAQRWRRLAGVAAALPAVLWATSAAAVSLGSEDGDAFRAMTPPITLIQERRDNAAAIVEQQQLADSAVLQTGTLNRAAFIQFGSDKLAILRQPGRYNRALIVQVGSSARNLQIVDVRQGGDPSAVNSVFTLQTAVDDPDPVAQAFAGLSLNEAQTVANNFLFAPELARVHSAILEDLTQHVISLLQARLDQGRFGRCGSGRRNAAAGATGPGAGDCAPAHFFATLGYGQSERDGSLGTLGHEQDVRSVTLGAELRPTAFSRIGAAVHLQASDGDVHRGLGDIDTDGYFLGVFASLSRSNAYLDLLATLGRVDFSTERFGGASKVRGDTDGHSFGGRLQGGYRVEHGSLRFGPLLSLGYSEGRVDEFWERGGLLLRQHIDEQTRARLLGSLGAELERQDRVGGRPLRSYLKVELERDFGIDREDTGETRFAFAPEQPVITPLEDVAEDTYGRISGGITLAAHDRADLSLAGSALVGADRRNAFHLYGTLSIAF